jgi:hypothetical protein
MRAIIATEKQEQRALVKWLCLHPLLKDYFCKIDNEGKREPGHGCNAKLMGLRPGVSDIFIYRPTLTYHGLWLEMKRNKKYTKLETNSKTWQAQENFLRSVKTIGYEGKMCYGWEDGIRIIEEYLLT